ncbi:MAG: transcription antitermination factor NusB [Azovibrio sp.]|nr:transcription antitermination factor NusB [Azovibrio sp.]
MREAKTSAPKAPPKSPRRRAREFALQGLYQWRVGGADEAAIEAHLPELDGYLKADRTLCLTLIRGVMRQHQSLADELAAVLDRPFAELSPIEANILLLATYELVHFPETPYRVIINEAIELAKVFGGTDGHRYVNGVLDKMAARLRPVEVAARRQPA